MVGRGKGGTISDLHQETREVLTIKFGQMAKVIDKVMECSI